MDICIAYTFTYAPDEHTSEILIAQLSQLGFESFLEREDGISAYIAKKKWHPTILNTLNLPRDASQSITWRYEEIAPVNWNAAWEESIQPLIIAETCTIRAPFHPPATTSLELIITPKMSFGTGHHETTRLMTQFILQEEIKGKKVLDMGCGTGILAILASKKEASFVDAVDVDSWSYLNTQENILQNQCANISVHLADIDFLKGKTYDVILANINKNTLLQHIPVYANALAKNGILLMSGFYAEDEKDITEKCYINNLIIEKKQEDNRWMCVKYLS